MTNHLLIVREGIVRLYRMNGSGAEEIATLRPETLPDDRELAVWAGALLQMTGGSGRMAAPRPERKLPERERPVRSRDEMLRYVLGMFSPDEWRNGRDLGKGSDYDASYFGDVARQAFASGYLERQLETDSQRQERSRREGTRGGRQAYLYRLTPSGSEFIKA